MDKNCCLIIQARMGSSRRPGKISYLLGDEPMLAYQIGRLKKYGIPNIIVATTTKKIDDTTEQIAISKGVNCFRGSENDVMKRFYDCCVKYSIETIIRIGGDDPLVDPNGVKALYSCHKENTDFDLIYTSHRDGWIYGTAAELFTFKSLKEANAVSKDKNEREHIIPYYKNRSKIKKIKLNSPKIINRNDIFLSVDYQEDLNLIDQIVEYFTLKNKRYNFTQEDLVMLYDSGKLIINNKHLHSGF